MKILPFFSTTVEARLNEAGQGAKEIGSLY